MSPDGPAPTRVATEAERLEALHQLRILDTGPERHFDAVCETARDLFEVPMALVTLIDRDRAWFKAKCGVEGDGAPLELTFCRRTIEADDPLICEDASRDPRFADHPLVTGEPHLRFYAGAPLVYAPGIRLGTLCVVGLQPRVFSPADRERLRNLAEIVMAHLRLHEAHQHKQTELAARRAREALIDAQARDLRESTALLRATLDNMDQGLIMVGPDDRVQIVNRRALDLLDLPAEFMAKKPLQSELRAFQIEAGEFAAAGPALQRRVVSARVQTDDPVYVRERPNGTVLEIRTVPLANGGAVRTYTDITARRRAEAAREESEARYRLLAEHASDLIVLGHHDGRRSYVSPSVRQMLGYTAEEARGMRMSDFVHPEDLPRVFATTSGLSAASPQASVVFRMRHRSGHDVFAEAAFTRVEANGDVTVVTAIRDVTERERQAAELTRAKDIAEEAQAKAEAANLSKTEFLASMSHEIRTPLNGILGYADLLMASAPLGEEQRRYVERIQSAGSALLTVVDDVLDFSRIEAGQIALDPVPFSPKALVGDAVSIVSSVADRKGLPVRFALDPTLPRALIGDASRLRQVLLNLLNNAVKFTRAGAVEVRVAHEGTTPEGEVVTFAVTDTGIGIPPDKRERLFRRFSQVDGSIRREFGGTGLGLAISKQLVEIMGGGIAVRSQPGEGSTFWFTVTLPRAGDWPAEIGPAAHVTPAARPARILLVEDLDINQDLARAVLQAAGHRVDVVGDGAEAIAAVQREPYDVVLMDVQMPGLDGLAATRRIRALDHPARHVPVIAMTANVLPQQVSACRQAGMNDHVGKPFRREDLYAAIDRALHPAPAAPPAPEHDRTPLLDETALAGLEAIGGRDLMVRLLAQFADDTGTRFAAPDDPERVARDAHALVASSGMLGLMRLSEACAALEQACLGGAVPEPLLGEVRALLARSVAAIRRWAAARP